MKFISVLLLATCFGLRETDINVVVIDSLYFPLFAIYDNGMSQKKIRVSNLIMPYQMLKLFNFKRGTEWSRDRSLGKVNKLRAELPKNCDSIPDTENIFPI